MKELVGECESDDGAIASTCPSAVATSHAPPPLPCPLTIEQLVIDHHAAVYRYAFRLAGNPQDAEELCQQTFLFAYKNLSQIRDPNKVLGWLFSILRNWFHKTLRKPPPTAATNLELEVDEIPDEIDDDTIDREQLQRALNQLSDEHRLILLAFYFEDCSYVEIAERLQLPTGTVMSRLSRAKAKLRAILLKTEDGAQRSARATSRIETSDSSIHFPNSTKMRSHGGETTSRIPQ